MTTFTKAKATKIVKEAFVAGKCTCCGEAARKMGGESKFANDVICLHKIGCIVVKAKAWLLLNK